MTRRVAIPALWLITGVALLAGAVGVVRAVPHVHVTVPAVWGTPPIGATPSRDSLAVLAERIANTDPFRLARAPASVAYGAAAATPAPPPAPAPPKPPLVLSGIVGPPWAALVDGIPGHATSVLLHAGDTVAALRVRAVTRTRVTLTGLDTTWSLVVHSPWH